MITLTAEQCRVIGVMLEKETTTPEQYPLSLNGITTACNQKSNREPVMSLNESDIQNVIDELTLSNQLMIDQKASTRVNKYFHRFCNTEFGSLQFTPQQRAIICVLLLRGPQTPGELRTRTNRLANFADVSEVEASLNQLQNLNGEVLVKKLAREPGKRDSRYVHLLSWLDEESLSQTTSPQSANTKGDTTLSNKVTIENAELESSMLENNSLLTQRVFELELQVASLTEQVACLTELFEAQ